MNIQESSELGIIFKMTDTALSGVMVLQGTGNDVGTLVYIAETGLNELIRREYDIPDHCHVHDVMKAGGVHEWLGNLDGQCKHRKHNFVIAKTIDGCGPWYK